MSTQPQPAFARTTITAALPYANGPLHLGHMAGVYVPADIYARFLRLRGEPVLFVCGSDEHGMAVTLRARKEGISPQQVVDRYHQQIKEAFDGFGISFDVYSRTSTPTHRQTSQEFFTQLYEKGVFTEEESEQYYDPEAQSFLADRYIIGTCPNCQNPDAYGDQCERCGSTLSPRELGNPRSALSGSTPELRTTKHWYLPLDVYENWLRQWILTDHKDDWKANVVGQCKSWLDQGLKPRAMSRDLDWGVPVPLPDAEGKVLYVWFDAPIGYVSATKDWAEAQGQDWKPWWQGEDTRLLHFIGKDNIVFHCLIFPTVLKLMDDFVLPDNVPAMEFMNLEGDKLSTSRNWAVWLHEYLEDFPDQQDVLRYVLCSNMPEAKDNDFTWKDFQAKNNNELVAILGNFVNRTVVLTHKYFAGKVPAAGQGFDAEQQLLQLADSTPDRVGEALGKFRFREAQAAMMDLARAGNKYLADTEPWKVIKTDQARVGTILHHALRVCGQLAVVMEPFLPATAAKLRAMLTMPAQAWGQLPPEALAQGQTIGQAQLLFSKVEDAAIEAQVAKLHKAKPAPKPTATNLAPMKDEMTFDDFLKMDLRVATVLTAEAVPKSNKLLRMQLDTGLDQRTVMSGIAKHYSPEEMVGKQVLLLANLAPRKIMGVESQGMILMAEDTEGNLRLMEPNAPVNPGSTVA